MNQKLFRVLLAAIKYTNISFFLLFIYFISLESNYFNFTSLILFSVISFLNIFALAIKELKYNPFAIVLSLNTTVFYSLRFVSLYFYGSSAMLDTLKNSIANNNITLVIIVISNFLINCGIFLHEKIYKYKKIRPREPLYDLLHVRLAIFLLLLLVLNNFYSEHFNLDINKASIAIRLLSILKSFFTPIPFLFFSMCLFMFTWKKIGAQYKLLYLAVLLIYVITCSLSGIRSGFNILIEFFVLNLIVLESFNIKNFEEKIQHAYTFKLKDFIYLSFTLIFIIYLVYLTYSLGTFFRGGGSSSDIGMGSFLFGSFEPLLSRVGYFDFAASIINNEAIFKNVINFTFYFKSFVDNLLTPGFDLFDCPKISNALVFIYNNLALQPIKSLIGHGVSYQSSQLSIYAEFYLLFGPFSGGLLLILFGYFVNSFYRKVNSSNIFVFYSARGLILYSFYRVLNSFGLDWEVIYITWWLFAFFIIYSLESNKIRKI